MLQADNSAITPEMVLWSNKQQLPLILNQDAMVDGIGSMKVERWEELIDQLKEINIVKDAISGSDVLP